MQDSQSEFVDLGAQETDSETVQELELTTHRTSKEDRSWGLAMHLSALGGYMIGTFSFLPPLVIWQIKKGDSKFLDHQGREALNFQLTMLLGVLISIPLLFVGIGILTLIGIGIYGLVYTIIAGVKANEGVWYRYPFSIKFVTPAAQPDA